MLADTDPGPRRVMPADESRTSSPSSITVVGLDHYAVHVRDLQRSSDWYERVFGFSILHKWNTAWMIGRGNVKVGLFLRPEASDPGDLDKLLVFEHVAFLVDGDKFDACVERLRALELEVEGPEDSGIAYSVFVRDPDGHQLEITTYHPQTPPSEAQS
jgi:catechol 2,3-dioxygenase-like lactoylglutathione lyase family enzyme